MSLLPLAWLAPVAAAQSIRDVTAPATGGTYDPGAHVDNPRTGGVFDPDEHPDVVRPENVVNGPGVHTISRGGVRAKFRVEIDPPGEDADSLSACAEAYYGSSDLAEDTDADGLWDDDEVDRGLDPALRDTDADGVHDYEAWP